MTIQTYPPGSAVVIGVLFGILTAVAALELVCDWKGWPSISHQVEGWADTHPWFSGGLLAIFFILLGHFVLNPLVVVPPCECEPKSVIDAIPHLG